MIIKELSRLEIIQKLQVRSLKSQAADILGIIHIPVQELEFWPGGPQVFCMRRAAVFIDTERGTDEKLEE
ncbi:MAG: hypothetical protein K1000chlam3_00793 [Chlamydiae bacterium]|nr:hypothetical protein [Chlamydiota bacterium]